MTATKLLFDIVTLTKDGKIVETSQYNDDIKKDNKNLGNLNKFVQENNKFIEKTVVYSNLTPMQYCNIMDDKKNHNKNYIGKWKFVANGKEEWIFHATLETTFGHPSSKDIRKLIDNQRTLLNKLAQDIKSGAAQLTYKEAYASLKTLEKATTFLNKLEYCASLYNYKDKTQCEAFQAYLKEEIQAFTNDPANSELRSNKLLLTKFFNLFLTAVACAISFGAYPIIQWYRNENTWVITPTYEHIVDHDLRNKVEQKCKDLQQASNLGKQIMSSNNSNILIVGAGPIGLITGLLLHYKNPEANITFYERFKVYQRAHSISVEVSQLQKLLDYLKESNDRTEFQEVIQNWIKDANGNKSILLPTNEIQNNLTDLITKHTKIKIEHRQIIKEGSKDTFKEGSKDTFKEGEATDVITWKDFLEKEAKNYGTIIGADGSHSIIRENIFGDKELNEDLQYVVEFKYKVKDAGTRLSKFTEYSNNKIIPFITAESISSKIDKDGNKDIAVRCFVDKATFDKLKGVRYDDPIKFDFEKVQNQIPIKSEIENNIDEEKGEDKYESEEKRQIKRSDMVTDDLLSCINVWLNVRKEYFPKETYVEGSGRLTKTTLSIYHSHGSAKTQDGTNYYLGGDSRSGVPFFKSFNGSINDCIEVTKAISDTALNNDQKVEQYNNKIMALTKNAEFYAKIKSFGLNVTKIIFKALNFTPFISIGWSHFKAKYLKTTAFGLLAPHEGKLKDAFYKKRRNNFKPLETSAFIVRQFAENEEQRESWLKWAAESTILKILETVLNIALIGTVIYLARAYGPKLFKNNTDIMESLVVASSSIPIVNDITKKVININKTPGSGLGL